MKKFIFYFFSNRNFFLVPQQFYSYRSKFIAQATSSGNIAAAGYVPGQQSYLKQRRTIWSKSRIARDLELQGFTRVYGVGS